MRALSPRPMLVLLMKQCSVKQSGWVLLIAAIVVGTASGAVLETIDAQRIEGEATISPAGRLVITASNAEPKEFTLDQIRVARFTKVDAVRNPLPRGWRVEDIGRVSGSSSDANGVFTLSVDPAEIKDKKWQALHYAYRLVHGEPIVTARILEMTGPKPALGGVMLRENMELTGAHVVLGVTGEKHLRLEYRENGYGELKTRDLGPVTLPIWLRLQRAEKESAVTAFRSSDGTNWHELGRVKLHCGSAPFPENSDHWLPRVFSGVGVTAATNTNATVRCDNAVIAVRGFHAEYFADAAFGKFAFARPERRIEYYWGDRSPAPVLEPENFSVRWRGEIEPKHSDNYRFYFDGPGTRLLIDGEEVPSRRWEESRKKPDEPDKEVPLAAGRKYQVQFEFVRKGRDAKSARLGWASKSQSREIIPSSAVTYTFSTNTPGDGVQVTNVLLPAGVWLRSGSFLAGEIVSSGRSATQVTFAGKPLTVLNNRVARLVLRTWRQPIRFEVASGRTGLFFQNGDFLESELEDMNSRSVIMSSVLFGQRTYSRENNQPLAIVLANVNSEPAAMEIVLKDGSTLRARSITGEPNAISVDEVAIGKVRVPMNQVQELRRLPSTDRASVR